MASSTPFSHFQMIYFAMASNISFCTKQCCNFCSCSSHSWRISSAVCVWYCFGTFTCSHSGSYDSYHYTCTLELWCDFTANYSSELATTGEKEWYFYCPRDRKYRNSARPNRVTGAGFWKATGTDRPVYSSEGTKCIGLKKSLVFYKGRASKGIKTDWMMHEFRLPSLTNTSLPKRPLDKHIPANDSWAICRIFKKTNSMAQRALSQSWVSPLPETTESDLFSVSQTMNANQFGSENISCTTEAGSSIQFSSNNCYQHPTSGINYPLFDAMTYYKPNIPMNFKSYPVPVSSADISTSFMFSASEMPMASMLLNLSPSMLGEVEKSSASLDFVQSQQCNGFSGDQFPVDNNGHLENEEEEKKISNTGIVNNNRLGTMKTVSFPFTVPPNISDEWKLNLPWDSPPCPSEMSTTFSVNKCYT